MLALLFPPMASHGPNGSGWSGIGGGHGPGVLVVTCLIGTDVALLFSLGIVAWELLSR